MLTFLVYLQSKCWEPSEPGLVVHFTPPGWPVAPLFCKSATAESPGTSPWEDIILAPTEPFTTPSDWKPISFGVTSFLDMFYPGKQHIGSTPWVVISTNLQTCIRVLKLRVRIRVWVPSPESQVMLVESESKSRVTKVESESESRVTSKNPPPKKRKPYT